MITKRTLLNARTINDNIHIEIPKTTSTQELSFVLSRVIYQLVTVYAENNHMTFNEALDLYKEAIYADVGRQYDIDHRHIKSRKPR